MFYLFDNNIIFLFILSSLLLSLAIDLICGELPVAIHPVVIIGKIIDFYKKRLIRYRNKLSSVALYFAVVLTSLFVLYVIMKIAEVNWIVFFIAFTVILSSTFSVKMLLSSAKDIECKLRTSIEDARKAVSYLVSRNTKTLTEGFIVSATIETLSENITDSYISPIFYYMIFGIVLLIINKELFILLLFIPIIYRISNTMDAMVGYTTDELKYIGFLPAKIDDVLNYIPSRLAGLFVVLASYLLGLNYRNSYLMYRRDSRKCPSPNSGFTMATFAGAIDIQLVKKDTYILGDSNRSIEVDDISKALSLSKLTISLFTITTLIIFVIAYMVI